MGLETCENCERIIGKIEQAYIYNNKIICKECYTRLHNEIDAKDINNSKAPINTIPYKKVQPIEKTGKQYKAGMLIGIIILLAVIPMAYSGQTEWSFLLGFIGGILFIVSKILAWWYHG